MFTQRRYPCRADPQYAARVLTSLRSDIGRPAWRRAWRQRIRCQRALGVAVGERIRSRCGFDDPVAMCRRRVPAADDLRLHRSAWVGHQVVGRCACSGDSPSWCGCRVVQLPPARSRGRAGPSASSDRVGMLECRPVGVNGPPGDLGCGSARSADRPEMPTHRGRSRSANPTRAAARDRLHAARRSSRAARFASQPSREIGSWIRPGDQGGGGFQGIPMYPP